MLKIFEVNISGVDNPLIPYYRNPRPLNTAMGTEEEQISCCSSWHHYTASRHSLAADESVIQQRRQSCSQPPRHAWLRYLLF